MAADDMISEEQNLSEMTEEELDLEAARMAEEEMRLRKERDEALESLAQSIESKFFHRAVRRKHKEAEWHEDMSLYLGALASTSGIDVNRPLSDQKASSRAYHNLVGNKCDIAIAQSVDMQFAGGEKNWSLSASVNSADPTERERARLMEKEIEAQLEHCAYGRKTRRAIEDRVILGTGVLKGPVNTGKQITRYEQLPENPEIWIPSPAVENYPSIEWVNPWFFYPDDTVNDFEQVSDAIQIHPSSALDLKRLMKHPGFMPEELAAALEHQPKSYMIEAFSDYTQITGNNPYLFEDKYVLMEYHGPITQDILNKLSIEPSYESVNQEYYGEVWVVCGKVVRIELENIEAAFELPYALSTWKKDPSSVFGFGSPLLMKDAQRVAREVWRMILDNASLSSGPQVASHNVYVEPVNGSWELAPNKAWRLLDSQVDVEKAIQFFNIPNVTSELMPVLNLARQFAEEESMTPMIAGGLQGAEAVDSASGALMMREASTTVLDFLSEDWDDNVTEKVIRRFYGWNMQYNPKPEIKGNYSIDVRTITEYKSAQMKLRDLERLSMEASQNPNAAMLLNMDELYRARFAAMRIPYAGIVKSPEEIEQIKAQQQNQPDPAMIQLEMQQKELSLKEAELHLKKMQLEQNAAQQQQREMWEHEQKMSANYARTVEAEAMVLRSQNEKETQYLQLAARLEEGAERNRIMKEIAVMSDATKRFDAGMKASLKQREQMLTIEEMKIKNKHGTGI